MKAKKYNLTQKEYDTLKSEWYEKGKRHGKQELQDQAFELLGIYSLNGNLFRKEEV